MRKDSPLQTRQEVEIIEGSASTERAAVTAMFQDAISEGAGLAGFARRSDFAAKQGTVFAVVKTQLYKVEGSGGSLTEGRRMRRQAE